ncbi:MAG: hypothetical protein AAF604_07140 [Acidobacteriota bacterium]
MSASRDLWRSRLLLWLPPLILLLVALVALGIYRGRYADQAEGGARSLDRATQVLSEVQRQSSTLDRSVRQIRTARHNLDEFHGDRLSTENLRLTKLIAEVKDLAETCGLDPRSISYPNQVIEDFGLRKRSFVFSVQGSYASLRRLINLLELSDSFLTLEQVTLQGSDQALLNIDLKISTLFSTLEIEPVDPVPVAENAPVENPEEVEG